MTKRAKTLSALLTALSVITLSACSSEESVNIDLAMTTTEANTNNAETAAITYETTAAPEDIDDPDEHIPADTQPSLPEIPPDKRIPYEGIELDISDAVEVNEYGDAIYDFSYLRYSSDFYVDSNDHDMSNFTVPPLENIEYIKVEKGQEISGGLKVASAQLWLSSNPDFSGNSEIVSSSIELEGSATWEGLLWFYGDDEPIVGDTVFFAADPSKNSEIPIGIEAEAGMSFYSNDNFRFVMDSNDFSIASIKDLSADIQSALRETGCIRIRATFTNICLSCSTRASGYNHSHAAITDVEILQ